MLAASARHALHLHGDQAYETRRPDLGAEFAEDPAAPAHGLPRDVVAGPDEYLLLGSRLGEGFGRGGAGSAWPMQPHALVISATGIRPGSDRSARRSHLERAPVPRSEFRRISRRHVHPDVLAKADIVLWRTREDAFHLECGARSTVIHRAAREIARDSTSSERARARYHGVRDTSGAGKSFLRLPWPGGIAPGLKVAPSTSAEHEHNARVVAGGEMGSAQYFRHWLRAAHPTYA